jgi:hypothetical protein
MNDKEVADALTEGIHDSFLSALQEAQKLDNSIRVCSKKETEPDFVAVEAKMERVVVVVRGRTYDMEPEVFFSMVEEYMDDPDDYAGGDTPDTGLDDDGHDEGVNNYDGAGRRCG